MAKRMIKAIVAWLNRKSYEADMAVCFNARTEETKPSIIAEMRYAMDKTNLVDKDDITFINTQIGIYIVLCKTDHPYSVARALKTTCDNRYFSDQMILVRSEGKWKRNRIDLPEVEFQIDNASDTAEIWWSNVSAGGSVLTIPQHITLHPALGITTPDEDLEVAAERERWEHKMVPNGNGGFRPLFYTLDPEEWEQGKKVSPIREIDGPEFMSGTGTMS